MIVFDSFLMRVTLSLTYTSQIRCVFYRMTYASLLIHDLWNTFNPCDMGVFLTMTYGQ